jgi:hypothetical protein
MADLFPQPRIERLDDAVDGRPVPVPHGSFARFAQDSSGRTWVRKRESMTGFQGLLAEAASWLLGVALEVRQPHAAVFHDGTDWSWMSELIPGANEHWSAELRDCIANLDEVGRMLALDAIVINEDRHQRNIMVQRELDGVRVRLWSIDLGKALIGQPSDFLDAPYRIPVPNKGVRGLPVDALRPAALDGAVVASQLSDELLRSAMAEACELVDEPEAEALADMLVSRCRRAPDLVTRYLDALGALS